VSTAKSQGSFGFIWSSSDLGIIVINTVGHAKLQYFGASWTGLSGSVTVSIIDIEAGAVVEGPDRG
jgi:hypothetical protein